MVAFMKSLPALPEIFIRNQRLPNHDTSIKRKINKLHKNNEKPLCLICTQKSPTLFTCFKNLNRNKFGNSGG